MTTNDVPIERVVAIPSDRAWLDPFLIARNLYAVTTDVETIADSSALLAKPDPYRWAVGFTLAVAAGSPSVSPWPQPPPGAGGWQLDSGVNHWFDLVTYGPLVQLGWYSSHTSASIIRVIEIIRTAPGV